MAIEPTPKKEAGQGAPVAGVRWATGANVIVATVLVVALVAVLQWGGYTFHAKADLTSTGINSLSEGTERLLDSLDDEVRITSLYFESDLETEEQTRFRKAASDLIELYRITNPSKIVAAYINPLQNHQRHKELFKRLQQIPAFQEQSKPYRALLDDFKAKIGPEVAGLLTAEQDELSGRTSTSGEDDESRVIGAIVNYFKERQVDLADVQDALEANEQSEIVDYTGAWRTLRSFYNSIERIPETLDAFVRDNAALLRGVSPDTRAYFVEAADRYRPLAEQVRAALDKGVDLPDLEMDRIARNYTLTGNCIIVDSDKDARLITFSDVWAPMQGGAPLEDGRVPREFRGEEKLSSAILQITQPTKPAVVFVRYGGEPLFFGGFQPNMPRPQYAQMKEHLESFNFTVHEWNLAATVDPPEIDPAPDKVIYVVLRPTPTPPPMMGRQQQDPPFGDEHRQALIKALEANPRALFITGWTPTSLGPMSTPYEYGEYVRDAWGIKVKDDVLVIQTRPVGPNEFRLARGFENLTQPANSDHVIVKGLGSRRSMFPLVAPLDISEELPAGVEASELLWFKPNDGLWGVEDIQTRVQEAQKTGFIAKSDADLLGPFTLAVAATRDEAKLVMVSSAFFAIDEVAFATNMTLTSQGLALVRANPSNVTLFVNALHWLGDNTQWMNLGRPIESRVLTIEEGPGLTFVRALAYAIWPGLALVCGGMVWIVRRR